MYESAIAEMRRHRESKEAEDIYEYSLKKSTVGILRMLNDDQFKSWMLVESLIEKEVKANNLPEDQVRALLMGGEL